MKISNTMKIKQQDGSFEDVKISYIEPNYCTAEGSQTTALGHASHAEGISANPISNNITNESTNEEIINIYNEEGAFLMAKGRGSHAEGANTLALGNGSHTEGADTIASGVASHAEGNGTAASGDYSHTEGVGTVTSKTAAHAEGYQTTASGRYSHTEGNGTAASAQAAHAEGTETTASGNHSHAEGFSTTASGESSHAEGSSTTASNFTSHAEGAVTTASGIWAHAEGYHTTASGTASHAGGMVTIATGEAQTAIGKLNIEDTDDTYAFIIGNGETYYDTTDFVYKDRYSNAFTVDWSGKGSFASTVGTNGADYAEYFEWEDKNLLNEDRVGYLVSLNKNKIQKAQYNDNILGIISGTAGVLGDNYEWEWKNKYLTDNFGRILYEEKEQFIDIPIFDEKGNKTIEKKSLGIKKVSKLNPEYNPDEEYISRADRPEWDIVGLMGKLYLRDDGTCIPGEYARVGIEPGVATHSEEETKLYVMERINNNIIRVFLR